MSRSLVLWALPFAPVHSLPLALLLYSRSHFDVVEYRGVRSRQASPFAYQMALPRLSVGEHIRAFPVDGWSACCYRASHGALAQSRWISVYALLSNTEWQPGQRRVAEHSHMQADRQSAASRRIGQSCAVFCALVRRTDTFYDHSRGHTLSRVPHFPTDRHRPSHWTLTLRPSHWSRARVRIASARHPP